MQYYILFYFTSCNFQELYLLLGVSPLWFSTLQFDFELIFGIKGVSRSVNPGIIPVSYSTHPTPKVSA